MAVNFGGNRSELIDKQFMLKEVSITGKSPIFTY